METKAKGGNCSRRFKSVDQFSENFRMKVSDNDRDFGSCCGALLTLIMSASLLVFIYTKTMTWHHKKDVDVFSTIKEGAFDYTYRFNSSEGLFLAAGLTNYDSNTTVTEEPRFGELVFEYYGWGNTDEIGLQTGPIETHFCSDEELGLIDGQEGESTLTYPIKES